MSLPCEQKIWSKLLYLTILQINGFLRFTQKFKMAAKTGRKIIFGKKCQMTLWVKNFAIYRNFSKLDMFVRFTQKFKMATKNGGKTFFAKKIIEICLSCTVRDNCVFVFYTDGCQKWKKIANLISKVNTLSNGQLLIRSVQTGPPNARRRRPVFPPAGRSQYCAFARWRMVFTSCLDNMTS